MKLKNLKLKLEKLLTKKAFNDSHRNKVFFFIFFILIFFPLLRVLLSGNLKYNLNIIFYTQKIYLIVVLFVFLSYLILKDKLELKKQDVDNTVVYGIVAIGLFIVLANLHVNFDTLMKMDALDIKKNNVQIGFGSVFADSIDLDKLTFNEKGIKKVVELQNISNWTIIKLYGWKDANSKISLSVNGKKFDETKKFSLEPSWVYLVLPGKVFQKGKNILEFKSKNSNAYLSSQWVWHDAKTLNSKSDYYGQEALVYIDELPEVSKLFLIAFKFKLILGLLAMFFLFLALFTFDSIKIMFFKFKYLLIIVGSVSTLAISTFFVIQEQWKNLSILITKVLYSILKPIFGNVYVNLSDPLGPIIGVQDFFVRIYKGCSGVESITIFIFLFLIIICFNWGRINKISLPFLFLIGIVGVFFVNIIRLVILILIGSSFSKELATHFFHTNLGWLFVLAYFFVFHRLCLCFVKSNKIKERQNA